MLGALMKPITKILLFLAAVPLIYLLADRFFSPQPPASRLDQDARDFQIGDFKLSSVKGHPIILHFWASWCGPCVQELPELLRLARTRKDLEFVAVSEDQNEAALESFLRSQPTLADIRQHVRVLLDRNDGAASLYGSNRFPETFLIGRDFRIDNHLIGPQRWTYPETAPLLARIAH
jgi:cytochrome c biogenesis protein CcmG, thiol:disulfide interchange protein DsbE